MNLAVEPSTFTYQCPLCPWTVRSTADPERGVYQPQRGVIREHLLACQERRKRGRKR